MSLMNEYEQIVTRYEKKLQIKKEFHQPKLS